VAAQGAALTDCATDFFSALSSCLDSSLVESSLASGRDLTPSSPPPARHAGGAGRWPGVRCRFPYGVTDTLMVTVSVPPLPSETW